MSAGHKSPDCRSEPLRTRCSALSTSAGTASTSLQRWCCWYQRRYQDQVGGNWILTVCTAGVGSGIRPSEFVIALSIFLPALVMKTRDKPVRASWLGDNAKPHGDLDIACALLASKNPLISAYSHSSSSVSDSPSLSEQSPIFLRISSSLSSISFEPPNGPLSFPFRDSSRYVQGSRLNSPLVLN